MGSFESILVYLCKLIVLAIILCIMGCNTLGESPPTIEYPVNSSLPEFLAVIHPEADSVLTPDQYLQPLENGFSFLQNEAPGICVQFNPISLLEDDDENLKFSDYQSRMIWELNDENLFINRVITTTNYLGMHGELLINLETGEETIIKPFNDVGPYDMCAPVGIDELQEDNRVIFAISSSSGVTYVYSWTFKIQEGQSQ